MGARAVIAILALLGLTQPALAGGCSQPQFAAARGFASGNYAWFVASGDFNGDGKADIAVANFTSNNVSILLGNGDGTLQPAVNYAVGGNPTWIAVADFNGDGKLDLAVASNGATGNPGGIFILLGKGDGTFAAAVNVAPGFQIAVAVGDLNGDGKPDLVAGGTGLVVLLGKGDGTFGAPTSVIAQVGPPFTLGDFNGDGKLDILTAYSTLGAIVVLPGNGAGGFGNPITTGSPGLAGTEVYVTAKDFNGDGRLDVVTAETNTVSVWLGNGDGTFKTPTSYPVASGPASIAVADFNGDAKPDLVVVGGSGTAPAISILLGKGDGKFQTAVNYVPTGHAMLSVAVADFNGDGKLDLALTSQLQDVPAGVWIVTGNGDGTFQSLTYATGTGPQTAAFGDFNGDGKLDMAVANDGSNNVSVFLGNGDGTFRPAVNYPAGSGATAVAVGDFNGDGKLDLVVANVGAGTFSLLLGNGDGTFQAKTDTSVLFGAMSLAVGDFNKDGKPDVAVLSILGVTVYLGTGGGKFSAGVNYGTRSGLGNIVVADFNGDGNPDLAVANTGSNTISIYLGNGAGAFASNMDFTAGTTMSVQSLTAADFNGDGKLDLAVTNFGCNPCNSTALGGNVAVLMGNGDGTFQAAVYYPGVNKPTSITAVDFNGDGSVDLAFINFFPYTVTVLQNKGDGTFLTPTPPVLYGAGNGPVFVAAVDVNGDGKPDLVALNGGSNSVTVMLNKCGGCIGACAAGSIASVVNGASFLPGIAPGTWITILGTNLSATTDNWASAISGNNLPTQLDGVSVKVNNLPAYVAYISPTQLNVLSPDDTTIGPVQVQASNGGALSNSFTANTSMFSPAFFPFTAKYVAATHANGAPVGDPSIIAGATPAKPGETIVLWGTGFGPTNPPTPTGVVVSTASPLARTLVLAIGGQPAFPVFAGVTEAGLDQINVTIPTVLADGDASLSGTIAGALTESGVFITVRH